MSSITFYQQRINGVYPFNSQNAANSKLNFIVTFVCEQGGIKCRFPLLDIALRAMLNNRIIYLLTWAVAIFIKVYLYLPSDYSESKPLLLTINVFKWGEVKTAASFDSGPIPLALAACWQVLRGMHLECTTEPFVSEYQKLISDIRCHARLLLAAVGLCWIWGKAGWGLFLLPAPGKGAVGLSNIRLTVTL